MSDATTALHPPLPPPESSSQSTQSPNSRARRRGGRGSRASNQTHHQPAAARPIDPETLALRPASVGPASSPAASSPAAAHTQSPTPAGASQGTETPTGTARDGRPNRRGGGDQRRRGGNTRRRGADGAHASGNQERGAIDGAHAGVNSRRGGLNAHTQVAGRRQFGGQLTSEPAAEADSSDATGLQADAADFVPGQEHKTRTRRRGPPRTHAPGPRARAGSIQKSNAEDILSRTHEDIASGAYECLICSDSVHRRSKIWTCHTCWAVLHLSCIRKWSSNEAATVSTGRLQSGDLPPPRQWRCPGCNLPQGETPGAHTCWCGKESDPANIPGLPPHSCGQSCGKEKTRPKRCPHSCDLVCHAGPCPPCTAMGPEASCFCGKHGASKRCVDTNYDEGWSCGEVCDDMMPCGDPDHTCKQSCHEGLCGACEVSLQAKCYCGQVEKTIICSDKGDEHTSRLDGDGDDGKDEWTGIFKCSNTCDRQLDCGRHSCDQACHIQGLAGGHHCPRSVDVITHCTCGKTTLKELGIERQSCEDPVPACTKICERPLPCGHPCAKVCHAGDCPPCPRRVDIECLCGRTSSPSLCHQGLEEAKPLCMRVCRTTLNCGRHACEQHCCSGERRAAERVASKRRHRPLLGGGAAPPPPAREDFEAEHICVRQCARPLSCGNPEHTCQELCHRGKCNTCPNAIFDEISCHCGRTVLYPPLPCGTGPPPCRAQCQRPGPCSLHPPVQHNCHGDAEACPKCPFLTAKKCMCGKKTLKNQPCFSTNVSCGTVCGNTLACGQHACGKTCHPPGACEDTGNSNGTVGCTQACGRPKARCGHPDLMRCHVPEPCLDSKPCQSKMVIACECARLRVETKCLATGASDGNLAKKLSCDEECARQARNRQLALALNVDPDDRANSTDHVPYEAATLRLYQELGKFAAEHEQRFRLFAADGAQRSLRFRPMKKGQRALLHALSADFGFESESLDPEPHRHVVVFKTPRFVSAPMKTIAECIRIRALQGRLKPVAAAGGTAAGASSSANASDNEYDSAAASTDERIPYNGFVLGSPRFGLTIDELQRELGACFRLAPALAFDVAFLPNEEVVIKARAGGGGNGGGKSITTLTPEAVQTGLRGLKPSLAGTVAERKLAGRVGLCVLDGSMNLARREEDAASANAGGWSTVAKGLSQARAAAAAAANQQAGASSVPGSRFVVLGKKKADASAAKDKSKRVEKPTLAKEESIVDDWEEAMNREEEEREKEREKEAVPQAGSVQSGDGKGDSVETDAAKAADNNTDAVDDAVDDAAM